MCKVIKEDFVMIGRLGFAVPGCMARVNNPGFKGEEEVEEIYRMVEEILPEKPDGNNEINHFSIKINGMLRKKEIRAQDILEASKRIPGTDWRKLYLERTAEAAAKKYGSGRKESCSRTEKSSRTSTTTTSE